MMKIVRTTYSNEDVQVLLSDLSGKMTAIDTEEREKLIQSGVHYSEMLPLEYRPTDEYMRIYEESLATMSEKTAIGIKRLSEILYSKHGENLVIISLARAGTPVGILVKRYLKVRYNIEVPHYSISIIRGKGIDINAMEYIYSEHSKSGVEHFQFLDGWTGKGAISRELSKDVNYLHSKDSKWQKLSDDLAVLADPANICKTRGTAEDFLIPSACLNATVSGMFSRTILNDLVDVENGEYHGSVYFEHLEGEDKSIEFINEVSKHFSELVNNAEDGGLGEDALNITGMEVVNDIAKEYGIDDVNKIKPGVGETTRVLLRRVPWAVLIDENHSDLSGLEHIKRLCKEKGIPLIKHSLGNYKACGIIKDMSADA